MLRDLGYSTAGVDQLGRRVRHSESLRFLRSDVNANCVGLSATLGIMDELDTPGRRLRWSRKRFGFKSATAAALRFGVAYTTYAEHESGRRNFGIDEAKVYGRTYKVPWLWLLEGPAGPPPSPNKQEPTRPTVKGMIAAGTEASFELSDELNDPIELPPASAIGVRVRGNSMYPRYMDGEKLLYLPEHRPASELVGRECAVKVKDGGMLVKIIRPGSKRGLFNLESWNRDTPTIEDVKIEWASPIKWRAP